MGYSRTGRLPSARTGSRRMFISIVCSLVVHAGVFVAVQYGIRIKPPELPEYSGPLTVTLQGPAQLPGAAPEQVSGEVIDETSQPFSLTPLEEMGQKLQEERLIEQTRVPALKTIEPERPSATRIEKFDETRDKPFQSPERKTVSTRKKVEKPVVDRVVEKDTVELTPAQEPVREEEVVGVVSPRPDRWKELAPWEQPKTGPQETAAKPGVETPPSVDISRLDKALPPEKSRPQGVPEDIGETGSKTAEPVSESLEKGRYASATEGEAKETGLPLIEWDRGSAQRGLLFPAEKPEVPRWVQEEGRDLKVVIFFTVTPEGHTTSLIVMVSSGYSDVDAAALDKARKLKFFHIQEKRFDRGKISYFIITK